MPWLETAPMEERERFIHDWRLDLYTMTELCARYDVSRKTGYKWLARFDEGGRQALRRSESSAASVSPSHLGGDRAADLRRAAPASDLGTGEAPGLARAAASGSCLAGGQHGGRSAGAQGPGEEAAATTRVHPSRRRAGDDHAAERPLDRGLQRPVPDRGSDLLLSADGRRPAHALPAGVSGPALDERRRRAPDLRSPLPRLRAAAGDSHRQRRALRDDRDSRAVAPQRVVAAARHSAPTDPARASATERRARAHAQDAQGRGDSTAAESARGAAAGLQRLSRRVQRRAAAPVPARSNARVAATGPSPRAYTGELPPLEYPGTSS